MPCFRPGGWLGCVVLCAALSSGMPRLARAQNLSELFEAGNAAFFQGNFDAAVSQYTRLVDAGVEDANVYFNLATAHARAGELGRAILYFERSARLAPGDDEVANALAMARSAVGKRRAQAQGEALVQARPDLADALSRPYAENTLSALLLVLQTAFFGLLIARRWSRNEGVRTGLAVAAAASALGLAAVGLLLAQKLGAFDHGKPAIVLEDDAVVREGPDPRARSRALAHEGASARVLARDGSFLRVRVQDGADGWMQASQVGLVTPD